MDKTTHFGYQQVAESEKAAKVAEVFHSVAAKYDLMNDLMSAGLHRLWKRFAVAQAGLRPGMRVLDVAGGTADLTRLFLKEVGESGTVLLTDINFSMLREGRDRMLNEGRTPPAVQCDGERLPFPDNHFDCVSVAFGLRTMTHKDQALAAAKRLDVPVDPGASLFNIVNEIFEETVEPNLQQPTFICICRLADVASEADGGDDVTHSAVGAAGVQTERIA